MLYSNPSLDWLLSLRRNSSNMPPFTVLPINLCTVRCHTIVPHDHSPRRPLDPALQILAQCNMIVQELEQVLALFLLEADDVARELRVYIDGLFACDRMRPDDGVDAADRIAADDPTLG